MSSFWENKFLSAERSIQFMQEAHSDILAGLHNEIDSLQKQCSNYALRLSMQASTAQEKEEFDMKFKSFNSEYKKRDALIAEQKNLIEERNKNIKTLQDRVKSLEKKLELETSSKDKQIKELKALIDSQSVQIANLTFQLNHSNGKTAATKTSTQNALVSNNNSTSNQLITNDSSSLAFKEMPASSNKLTQSNQTTQEINNLLSQQNLNSARRINSPTSTITTTTATRYNKNKQSLKNSDSFDSNNFVNQGNDTEILTNNNNHNNANKVIKSRTQQMQSFTERKNSAHDLQDSSRPLLNNFDNELLADMMMLNSNQDNYHQTNPMRRSNSSNSNLVSARSDRSQSPQLNNINNHNSNNNNINKVLPPVVKRPSENVPPPDPKPFLQSAASTLHARTKKELIQRRTLMSLPPIKPFELNQLAVESPHKLMMSLSHNNSSLVNGQPNEPKNNSSN